MPSPNLERADLDRIGGFNLAAIVSGLKRGSKWARPISPTTLRDILLINGNPFFVRFFQQFYYGEFRWKWSYYPSTETRFYFGSDYSNPSPHDIQTALAVYEGPVQRVFQEKIEEKPLRKPFYARFSGIERRTKRIIAATYNLQQPGNPLLYLNISMSQEEAWSPTLSKKLIAEKIIIDIPTQTPEILSLKDTDPDPDFTYTTAGFITDAMVKKATGHDATGSEHNKALVVAQDPRNFFTFGKLASLSELTDSLAFARDMGLFLHPVGHFLTISRGQTQGGQGQVIPGWNVQIPLQLAAYI